MPTNNHNFSQPVEGTTPWTQDWHDNFDALDARVALRGPAAERTNFTSYTDTLYFATDTEEVYRGLGDGMGWEQLESFGSNPTLNSVTSGSVDTDELNTVRTPKPSSGGAGIQNAVDELAAVGGGLCLLRTGEYVTSETINLKSNVWVSGCGFNGTTIKLSENADVSNVHVFEPADSTVHDISVTDLEIDGNRQAFTLDNSQLANYSYAVRAATATEPIEGVYLARLHIHDTPGNAVSLRVHDSVIEDCIIENPGRHFIRFAQAVQSRISNLLCRGQAQGCFSGGSEATTESVFENIRFKDITNRTGAVDRYMDLRDGGGGPLTVDGVTFTNVAPRGLGIQIRMKDVTLKNVHLDGELNDARIIEVWDTATNFKLDGMTAENLITSDFEHVIRCAANATTFRDVTITESADSGSDYRGIVFVEENVQIENATVTNATINVDDDAVRLAASTFMRGVRISDTNVHGGNINVSTGVVYTMNGWGVNAGDPSVEGDWNGEGYEGATVYDTTNGVKYAYVDGAWR